MDLLNSRSELQIFYDETNNIRRLLLSEVGLNSSINQIFAIGGIALLPGQSIPGWDKLRTDMKIQSSATELKFKHVGHSDYEQSLASPKIFTFLSWLLENDILIHYSVLDVLYWSTIDIVDSLQDPRVGGIQSHLQLKNELNDAVQGDAATFMAILHRFAYPAISRDHVGLFLQEVSRFVESSKPEDRNPETTKLKQVLERASKLPNLELPFLHDNEEGELIPDFSAHFIHLTSIFKRASHVFDRESYIEGILREQNDGDGLVVSNFRFADSKDEIGIQASDIVTGLVGRHFSFLRNHTMEQLRGKRASFSERQSNCMELLRTLIRKSDAYSERLLHAVIPMDTIYKNNEFLHEQRSPEYLL